MHEAELETYFASLVYIETVKVAQQKVGQTDSQADRYALFAMKDLFCTFKTNIAVN